MNWLEQWTGWLLQSPSFLWLLLLLPIAWWLRRRRPRPALRFAPADLAGDLPRSLRQRSRALGPVIEGFALALAVVALARPVERIALPAATEGMDIVLCVDLSSSMAAKDLDPARDRLEVAKDAAREFVAGRPDDRIGLVTFARFSDLRCPTTLDHGALLALLQELRLVAADSPEDATGIGGAVARAAQLLAGSPAKSRVVILLTDGEENVATANAPQEIAPVHAAQLCRELGVRVYSIAIGIGTRGPGGQVVPLDTTQVAAMATTTGGASFLARNAGAVRNVYARIGELETSQLGEPQSRLEERFLGPLLAAIGLWLCARLLQTTWWQVAP